MLQLFIALIGIILTIFFVVGIHEFGHFIAARCVGVKVERFSLGFGKPLLRRYDKKGTEYVIAPIPLGGYVKMLDEGEGEVAPADLPFAFNRQPFYKKFIIVIAGPLFNLIFAFLIYWVIFMVGYTSITPIIGNVKPDSIAAAAGLQPKQEIIRIDDKATSSWASIIINILSHTGNQDHLLVDTLYDSKTNRYNLNLTNWQLDALKPDPLESLGIVPYEPMALPIIFQIDEKSPAKNILKVKDKIIAVNDTPVKTWSDLAIEISQHPNTTLIFTVNREGKTFTTPITTLQKRDAFFRAHGFLGIAPQIEWPKNILRYNQYDPLTAFSHAWQNTRDFINLNFIILGKMLTGKISIKSLGGPIAIFENAGTALNNGIMPFFSFLAFLSIAIGILNILPIPGLDGGHVLFQVIEWIIRRPIPIHVQLLFYRLGFILLILLIAQALINDILRL